MASFWKSTEVEQQEKEPFLAQDAAPGYQRIGGAGDYLIKPDRDPISGVPSGPPEDKQPVSSIAILVEDAGSWNPFRKEIPMIFYFVTSWVLFLQGISEISSLAISYFYKDEMKVDPAVLSTITTLSALPWTIKPLYGFLSDGWPIMGYRRKPYLLISGVVGSISWGVLAFFVNEVWFGFACLFLGSMCIAVSNVIAEGMIVEKSRGQSQEFASHLQAMVHGAQAVGGIIAAYFSGLLLDFMTNRQVFMLCGLFPLTLIIVALISPEERFTGDVSSIRADMGNKLGELWTAFKRPEIFKPVCFVFLLNATPSTGSTWFYFYTNQLGFASDFLGTINVVGAVCSLGGVLLFGNFLANTPFRPILIWSTIIATAFGLSQLALVFGWNRAYGIPDEVFCLGESAILSVLGWINTMPILVLASRLCPQGMEATMYAMIMSVNNLGGVIGAELGALLTWQMGITEKSLDNFWILVLVCNLSTVLPLLFIGWIPEDGKDIGAEMDIHNEAGGEKIESKAI